MSSYVIQAFDANHNWLDTSNGATGDPTQITGALEMLQFVNRTKAATLHDYDAETHTTKRIAYWLICVGGVVREVYTTAWGRRCTKTMATMPKQGPGCRPACPVPTI